jgi:small subunit ribosomal protein S20
MANHVSSLKRARQTVAKTSNNRSNKSKLRGTLRTLREAIAAGDSKTLMAVYSSTASSSTRASRRAFCTRTPPAATRAA